MQTESSGPLVSTPLGEAIRILGIYTAGRFDIWALSGPAKASCRAHVLSTLLNKSVPKSKAGVNAIRDAFYSACKIEGECPAHRESNFAKFCEEYGSGDDSWKSREPGLGAYIGNS